MSTAPPPWRVFDPPPAADDGGARPPADDRAGAATPGLGVAARGALGRPEIVTGLVLAIVGLVAAVFLATGGPAGLGGPAGPVAVAPSDAVEGTAMVALLVVDVAGAVARPGVYRLPSGSRISDAISAAGGFGPRVAADLVAQQLNLAAVLHDGDHVLVPSRDAGNGAGTSTPTGGSAPGSGSQGAPIDLNTATEAQLDTLPGIGPVTAGKIVAARASQRFRSAQDLLDRKLVSQKTFDAIKPLVTVH